MEENEKIKTEVNFNSVNEQNNNSENKPRNKKLTIVLISLIIVLILAIGVCAGLWFAGDTTKTINNKEELVEEEEKNTSKKIDETKPWVYDADYLGEREDKQRTNQYTGEIYKVSKNLVAPYININSEYAKKVNEEILSLYNECYNKFGTATGYDVVTGTQNTDPDVAYILNYLEYEFYETDNILSILITKTDGAVPGDFGKEHYIYNINLKTLNEASFEDVYKECGFKTENEVNKKIDITLTNAKNNDEIFQDTVWDTGMFYMGKNNIFNIIINGHVNRISLEVKTDVVLEQKKNETDVTEKIESNQTENKESDYADEYVKIIDQLISENENVNGIKCDLIYFNEDDIPDLVIDCGYSLIKVYMYENGIVYNPINESYGTGGCKYYDYYEKRGVISSFGTGLAGATCGESFYILNSKKEMEYTFSYTIKGAEPEDEEMKKQAEEELNKYGGYYYKEQKITEEEFESKLKEYGIEFSTEKSWNTESSIKKALTGTKSLSELKKQLEK